MLRGGAEPPLSPQLSGASHNLPSFVPPSSKHWIGSPQCGLSSDRPWSDACMKARRRSSQGPLLIKCYQVTSPASRTFSGSGASVPVGIQ
jgi:hypothetical protein